MASSATASSLRQARSLSPGTTSSGSEEEVLSSRQRTGGFTAAAPLVIGNSSGRERLVAITEVEGSPATEYSAASGDDDDDEDGQTALSLAMQHATLDEGQRDETQAREFAEMQQIGGGMLKQVAIKSGYLYKKGEKRKTWKKRYFVLRPDRVCYYKNAKEYQILRHIDVADVHACAQIEVKHHDNSFGIVTPKRTYYVRADTAEDVDDWVNSINAARAAIEQAQSSTPPATTRPVQRTEQAFGAISQASAMPIAIVAAQGPVGHLPASDKYLSSSYASTSASGDASETTPSFALSSSEEDDEGSTTAANIPMHIDSPASVQIEQISNQAQQFGPARQLTHIESSRTIVAGYLMKQGKRKSWRKRWFVLTSQRLSYSRSHVDSKVNRSIPLDRILDVMEFEASLAGRGRSSSVSRTAAHISSAPNVAQAAHADHGPGVANCFKIITPSRTFVVSAPTEEDEIQWLSSIRVLIFANRKPVQPVHAAVSPAATAAAGQMTSAITDANGGEQTVKSASRMDHTGPAQGASASEERVHMRQVYPSIESQLVSQSA